MQSLFVIAVLSFVSASVHGFGIGPGCPCKFNFDFKCGTDFVTYDNQCYLECAGAEKLLDGRCPECQCSDPGLPVCDKDGNVYGNECMLDCYAAVDSTIKKKKCKKSSLGQVVKACKAAAMEDENA